MKGLHHTLYKRVDGVLRYREAWSEAGAMCEREGVVGECAARHETLLPPHADAQQLVARALDRARNEGYAPLHISAYARLLVECALGEATTEKDADDRNDLEYRIGVLLDRTGLGGTSGGEVWPTSYEVFCYVADFAIASRVIAADLRDTKYAGAFIHQERAHV